MQVQVHIHIKYELFTSISLKPCLNILHPRNPAEKESLVFGTSGEKAPEMKHINEWLKKTFASDFCSPEEVLTAKAWRKGWSNWAEVRIKSSNITG